MQICHHGTWYPRDQAGEGGDSFPHHSPGQGIHGSIVLGLMINIVWVSYEELRRGKHCPSSLEKGQLYHILLLAAVPGLMRRNAPRYQLIYTVLVLYRDIVELRLLLH